MSDTFDDVQQTLVDAMLSMQTLIAAGETSKATFPESVKLLLIGLMSTAADLAELNTEGGAAYVYGEMEAAAKQQGVANIANIQTQAGAEYSVSEIAADDMPTAMNYVGQQLSATLQKALYELPPSLRNLEMYLRPIEVLLGNLLNQKFAAHGPHQVLDNLCEHVHMALNDLDSRKANGNIVDVDFK